MLSRCKAKRVTTLDRLFDDFFNGEELSNYYQNSFSPNIDIIESKNKINLSAELAGLDKKDVKVEYKDGALRISGEKAAEKKKDGARAHRVERSYGSFQRYVPIKESDIKVDSIKASFNNGLLSVEIEKLEQNNAKEIEIAVQ
jgi:HSP20 family protein